MNFDRSNRFCHKQNPFRSQYNVLILSLLRFMNTNRCPLKGFSCKISKVYWDSPFIPLRKSTRSEHKYTSAIFVLSRNMFYDQCDKKEISCFSETQPFHSNMIPLGKCIFMFSFSPLIPFAIDTFLKRCFLLL